jgi:hypothetical protein
MDGVPDNDLQFRIGGVIIKTEGTKILLYSKL